jgi:tRNA pseudouridine55 synthase
MVSALRVGGRRLHEIARRGETIERLPRPVRIDVIELIDFAPSAYPEAVIRVVCGPGTYIRVLADDIAAALGTRAHLSALHRVRVGRLTVEKHGIDDLSGWEAALIEPAAALASLPSVRVPPDIAEGVRHGVRFAAGPLADQTQDEPEVVLDEAGHLLAVYRKGRAEVVLG